MTEHLTQPGLTQTGLTQTGLTQTGLTQTGLTRLGVFGGSFDPIHIGHLILMEEARFQLKLDRVFLVPAADPPHKQDREMTPVDQRVAMIEHAISDNLHAVVSRIDADRPGPHYTADMLRLLQAAHGNSCELFFLMGLDSLRDLPTWHQPMWLVQNCRLVVLNRHDVEIDWQQLEAELPGVRERIVLLDMPELEISSSILRKRTRAGLPIRYQVPSAVETYIKENFLYIPSE